MEHEVEGYLIRSAGSCQDQRRACQKSELRHNQKRALVFLEEKQVEAFNNGVSIASGSWTSAGYPTLAFANVDLYAPHNEPVFYDDLSLVPTPGVLAMLGMAGLIGVRRRRT